MALARCSTAGKAAASRWEQPLSGCRGKGLVAHGERGSFTARGNPVSPTEYNVEQVAALKLEAPSCMSTLLSLGEGCLLKGRLELCHAEVPNQLPHAAINSTTCTEPSWFLQHFSYTAPTRCKPSDGKQAIERDKSTPNPKPSAGNENRIPSEKQQRGVSMRERKVKEVLKIVARKEELRSEYLKHHSASVAKV